MSETKNMIQVCVPARAGILGNPSDGFHGKTLAAPVRNFHAKIILFEWEKIEILPGPTDHVIFNSLDDMITDIRINGYYGGFRLIKAAVKQFYEYVNANDLHLPDKNFTIRYWSNIPRQVGLAGSSAIITATIKALCKFYGILIEKPIMANYVLWSETKELGIPAGLQDRVVQVYDAPVFMDFDKEYMDEHGHGIYTPVDASLIPEMYLAYQINLTHKTKAHYDIRNRWLRGEKKIVETMKKIAENAEIGFNAIKNGDLEAFKESINKNFDLRASIYPISQKNMKMIKLARALGATAKFPGSGGAIIGTVDDDLIFRKLKTQFELIGCNVVKIKF
ncbi:MAG: mevalonate kinase family protein [Promethearchaeota archaeon]